MQFEEQPSWFDNKATSITSQRADGSTREEAKTVLASAANIAKALSMAANSCKNGC